MAKDKKELTEAQKNAIEAKKANIAKQMAKKTARRKRKKREAEKV